MIAGVLLLVVGLVALAGGSVSWVMFGVMLWVGMWMLFGGRRRHRRRMRWAAAMQQVTPRPPYPLVPTPRPAPAALAGRPGPRPASQLPPDVETKVDRIRRKAAVLGQHAQRFPLGSKDLYVVQHTATDYLPTTINAFLEVPAWSVDTPTPDGRTPLKILHDQLDLLEAKLDEIAESVRNQRVDRLLANERFLEERFGRRGNEELNIPNR
jgi:hypothetical protein